MLLSPFTSGELAPFTSPLPELREEAAHFSPLQVFCIVRLKVPLAEGGVCLMRPPPPLSFGICGEWLSQCKVLKEMIRGNLIGSTPRDSVFKVRHQRKSHWDNASVGPLCVCQCGGIIITGT